MIGGGHNTTPIPACVPACPAPATPVLVQVSSRPRHVRGLERLARWLALVRPGERGRVTNLSLQPVEDVAFALELVARNAVNRLAGAFGERLVGCLRDARSKPAYGSVAALTELLTV